MAKTTTKRTTTSVRKTVKKASKTAAKKTASSKEKKMSITETELSALVERRAYELFCKRGCSHGDNHADWYIAEKEVKRKLKIKN